MMSVFVDEVFSMGQEIRQDVISKAISNNKHRIGIQFNVEQDWSSFFKYCRNKKIVIYGAGKSFEYLLKCNFPFDKVVGIVDADRKKLGSSVEELFPFGFMSAVANMTINAVDSLKQYEKEETVIVITNINYIEDIYTKLLNMGFIYVFSFLMMESCCRLSENEKMPFNEDKDDTWLSKLDIQPNKILFFSQYRYNDHGKYIAEQLKCCDPRLELVWIVDKEYVDINNDMKMIDLSDYTRVLYEYATARIVITNSILPKEIKKKNNQIYIETKHWSSITLKRFYLDSTRTDAKNDPDLNKWFKNVFCPAIDFITVGSKFDEESSRRGFDFSGEVWNVGSPRTDAMFCSNECKRKVCSHFNIEEERKILLYAPTYRTEESGDSRKHVTKNIDLNYASLKNCLEQRFGGEWVIMLRLHPGYEKDISSISFPNYVLNASEYGDGEEICSACDILVSDYSSIMFEPAFVGKPVFLYATDMMSYINNEYDLLLDYFSLPFSICDNDTKLEEAILNFDDTEYKDRVSDFFNAYGIHEDGHASERAAKKIMELIGK